MSLREDVIVLTPTAPLKGELFVGADGLPELAVGECDREFYRPATIPNTWGLMPRGEDGLLLLTWLAIQELQSDIAKAQREHDDEERDSVRERAIETRIEEEPVAHQV